MKKEMVRLTINGLDVEIEAGATVLEAARKINVHIPTLCYDKNFEPSGSCRFCQVEVEAGGRKRLVSSCAFPVANGLKVATHTQDVVENRKVLAELLLARCSENKPVIEFCAGLGVTDTPLTKHREDCMLCGLCVQMCQERLKIGAISFHGRGPTRRVGAPYDVNSETCITCGACEFICPTGAITAKMVSGREPVIQNKDFEHKLASRGNIDIVFPSAVPLMPSIDRNNCLFFQLGNEACQICRSTCLPEAIDFHQTDKIYNIDVGTIVLSPGLQAYEPSEHNDLGYGRYPNVLTSIQFERMLSATGPFQGEVIRPGDGTHPKKIAWLQCIGSRDRHPGAAAYCSSVCCTYAIKQAIMAKEHVPGLDTALFYIDIRTMGKDFELYYNQARDQIGVRFIKSRISMLRQNPDTGGLILGYTAEAGRRHEEEFDLVVLSVGLCASKQTNTLAKRVGLELDQDGLPVAGSFNPVGTSIEGVLVCGAFQTPKDIPTSVMEASAAAGVSGSLLAASRWSQWQSKTKPAETDVNGVPPRVGIFICRCGNNIGGVIDVPALVEYAKGLPFAVHVEENMFSCSQDTQKHLSEVIKEHDLNRIVVAACTPRTHEPLFQETLTDAGLNKSLFEMANIRNHCSWVHIKQPAEALDKARDLVRMAAAKSLHLKPLHEHDIQVVKEALVIGGGLAGLSASKSLADQGFKTHLIERTDRLGGNARSKYMTWKNENIPEQLAGLIEDVKSHDLIDVYLESELIRAEGSVGRFQSTISQNGREHTLEHGAAIIASGASELKPDQYLYGRDSRVMTNLELERKLMEDETSFKNVKSAAFIQCVGSRIPERPYCSKVCCTQSTFNALKLRQLNPEMEIYIIHRDLRTYGQREALYREARLNGIHFVRHVFEDGLEVNSNGRGLAVTYMDDVLKRKLRINTDMLVLAAAVVPPRENPLAQAFKLPQNADGFFLEAHVKLRPVDMAVDGVFVCGLAHAPKPIDETVAQAQAAAARAVTILCADTLSVGGNVAEINPLRCTGCSVCVAVCPYQAIDLDEKGQARVNEAACKGCGTCVASCRSGAAMLQGFSNAAIFAQIAAF